MLPPPIPPAKVNRWSPGVELCMLEKRYRWITSRQQCCAKASSPGGEEQLVVLEMRKFEGIKEMMRFCKEVETIPEELLLNARQAK